MWAWKRLNGPRSWRYLADLLTTVREALGMREYLNRRAALAGLEARHPLVDVDLIEFILRLPPVLAVDREMARPLVREAMHGSLPEAVRMRPHKSVFNTYIRDCLAQDLGAMHELLGPGAEIEAYVEPEKMRRLLLGSPDTYPRGWMAWGSDLWRLANAELFLRLQTDPSGAFDAVRGAAGSAPRLEFEPLPPGAPAA
jgi:hypothetical protein